MPFIKISVLALASAVAAVPHYGGHGRYHSKVAHGAKPYPTGGWALNSTFVPQATGTGGYGGDTTIDVTSTSTTTLLKTVTVKPSPVASEGVEAADESGTEGGQEGGEEGGQCGPATVTVTAHEAVTITVTPGGGADVPVSSAAPVESKSMGEGYPAAPPAASTPEGEEKPTPTPAVPSSKVEQPYPTPDVPSSKVEQPYPTPTPAVPSSEVPEVPVPSSKAEYQPSSVEVPVEASSAVPSPAPSKTPSSGGSYSGSKRGLAYNDAALCKNFGSHFGFAYNWGQVENNDVGTQYIPMMHRPSVSTPEEWFKNVDKACEKGTQAVMGFNEPDHAEQANMTPDQACSAWKEYMNPIATRNPDVTIIGPSVTNGPPPMGLAWLQSFQDVCPDAIVHATNIHFYDIYEDATIDRFQAHIEKAHAQTGQKVWITEFGLNPGSASEEQAVKFLKAAMAYMDGSDIVQGYSWFMVGDGENQLNSGNGLSLVGEAYAS